MIPVMRQSWALLFGVMLLMIGNGMQGTLLGVRGEIEGFSTGAMSVVMSSYFAGFLLGSQMVPGLIQRVGHVRVFAALGSLASAGLIVYPVLLEPWAWVALRFLLGFCFCGVYIVAESWLNNTTTNETRGRALSLYLIAQSAGIVLAQVIFAQGDAGDYILFIVISVLVSLAFAPMLLSATPVPPFGAAEPMSFRAVYRTSPLAFVGIFLLGGVFAGMFGMAGVFGALAGLTPGQIALLASAMYTGGLIAQYPIGWASDRMDRRRIVIATAIIGAGAGVLGATGTFGLTGIMVSGFLIGAVASPLYGLLLAYANDVLEPSDMASASARLLFVNGVGAIGGPLVMGWLMGTIGPSGFFVLIAILMAMLAGYAAWRLWSQPIRPPVEEAAPFVAVGANATVASMGAVAEVHAEEGRYAEDAITAEERAAALAARSGSAG